LIATDINGYLAQHERKELLPFITCGSVDDGKRTLIGRQRQGRLIDHDPSGSMEKKKKEGYF
jgi:sulfate adenylyltransferase subunit 1 (EFTu-like GTPase family)